MLKFFVRARGLKIAKALTHRAVAVTLVLLLAFPFVNTARVNAQQAGQNTTGSATATPSQSQATSSSAGSATGTNQTNRLDQQPRPTQEQQKSQAPVGTAVAPYEKSTGVAASRPAGAVIAPAKQRRTRSFVIKVGLLVGAAAAIGTVAALSSASPSRPH